MLNSVVQGSGGYVYLNGKIISTSTDGSPQGNIIVNGGAGTITVNNSTGTAARHQHHQYRRQRAPA